MEGNGLLWGVFGVRGVARCRNLWFLYGQMVLQALGEPLIHRFLPVFSDTGYGYGHTDVVDILLDHGARVNHLDLSHQSALHRSAVGGHAEVASRLICAGGNATVQDDKGSTAFLLACQYGDRDFANAIIQALVDMKQDDVLSEVLSTSRDDRSTPLIAASSGGHRDVVELLISHEVDLVAKNADDMDALMVAVANRQLAVVLALAKDRKVDINTRGATYETPLICASAAGQIDIVRALIEAHADVNLVDINGCSPLLHAADGGHCNIINALLDGDADVDLAQVNGITPLIAAAAKNREDAVALLVRRKANVHLSEQNGITALAAVAATGHANIAHTLLEAGSDPNHQLHVSFGNSLLIHAASSGNADVVEALVKHGAIVNEQCANGLTALMLAARKGDTACCKVLLTQEAGMDLQETNGWTALHCAVTSGNIECVRLFVEAGANVNIEDSDGLSALHLAALKGEFEIGALLESVPGSKPLKASSTCGVWPVPTLFEFYEEDDTIRPKVSINPRWYIDASVIEESPSARQQIRAVAVVSEGNWLGSTVTLIKPTLQTELDVCEAHSKKYKTLVKELIVNAVNRWMPQSHPHVLKLYGMCHRGPPIFVVEHSQGTLRSYLRKHPDQVWSTLHKVALGLQYLHERNMYHGNLHGDIITFSDDGTPKLGGLDGLTLTNLDDTVRQRWSSSETISKRIKNRETDMHSFGMCIVEAVSGDLPYAPEVAAGADFVSLVKGHKLPARHSGFCDRGWELAKSLCGNAFERMPVETLVQELDVLVAEHGQRPLGEAPVPSQASLDRITGRLKALREFDQLYTDSVQTNLLTELAGLVGEIALREESALDLTFMRRCFGVLDRFALHLEARSLLNKAQIHSSRRQHAEIIRLLHVETERLFDELQSSRRAIVRGWRDLWSRWWARQQELFSKDLEALSRNGLPDEHAEAHAEQLFCTLFEVTRHSFSYAAIRPDVTRNATIKIIDILGGPLPDWFFPWYEVALATSIPFSKGGFGEVYRGKWMGSDVVVKKCIAFDQKVFVREVELWFKLDHPHIVKLFGACHVGQKFFVAEWAEHGQLDTYLARKKKFGRSVMWQKLHEAALGLRYLHVRGIVHRDLKCNNFLVGRDEKAKITDFGLSSPSEQSDDFVVTQTFGNARWAAPEVLAGGMPSYASDVFSFGMSIVEAVTGRVPYAETRDGSVVAALVAAGDFLVRPRCFERDGHWTLVTRCCAFDPDERVDMDEVIATLSIFADEEVHRHHNEIPCGSKSESVVREPEMILESTNDESMLVSKASRRDSQGVPANDLSTILTSMRKVGEVDIAPESPDLFISDASRRESHALEAGDHESSHGWSAMSHIYERSSLVAGTEEDGLSGATVYYSAWSHDEKPKARDVDSNVSTASTASVFSSESSVSAPGA